MSIDWRRTQPFCTPRCSRLCRCSRWPDYENRFGWPVRPGTYDSKVLATGPIAYWPQSETAGLTAHCLVNPAQDGTYTGVTLANDNTGPFGTPAPWYDGATGRCNIYSVALAAAFSGTEGTAAIWARVANVGVWTDAAVRTTVHLRVDGNNNTRIDKHSVNNTRRWLYTANADLDFSDQAAVTDVTWALYGLTWSDSGNQAIAYINGAQNGIIMTPIGTWAGALAATRCALGSSFGTAQAFSWHGWLGPCALWDRVLPPAEIAGLYVT